MTLLYDGQELKPAWSQIVALWSGDRYYVVSEIMKQPDGMWFCVWLNLSKN